MAMSLTSNGLLKVLVPGVVVGAVAILLMSRSGTSPTPSVTATPQGERLQLSQEEMQLLGVEGDTPQDTVATLVGRVRSMEKQLTEALTESSQLREQNQTLAERNSNVSGQINQALNEQRKQLENNFDQREQSMLSKFENRFDQLKNNYSNTLGLGGTHNSSDLPVGFGLEGAVSDEETLTWVPPMDRQQNTQPGAGKNGKTAWTFPNQFGSGSEASNDSAALDKAAKALTTKAPVKKAKPVYTIPANSTLMGSLGMTALIGRIPVEGTVNDPYPFKVLIGKDNLTANHIEIPEIQAAVVSGTASGDWTLSCVRGTITSITFVFEDGTIRTLPQMDGSGALSSMQGANQNQNSGSGGSSSYNYQTGLGYLSDPYGIPCVTGIRRSNAADYIGTQSLITAAGAGVATLLKADENSSSTMFTSSDASFSSTGNDNNALNNILSGGVSDIREWVSQLYGEAFAAIYVPPGQRVAINLNAPLNIDYEPNGRKVHHSSLSRTSYDLP